MLDLLPWIAGIAASATLGGWAAVRANRAWRSNAADLERELRNLEAFRAAVEQAAGEDYLCASRLAFIERSWPNIDRRLSLHAPPSLRRSVREARAAVLGLRVRVPQLRDEFVKRMLKEAEALLVDGAGRPLYGAQRLAVVRDENYNLVVAGAGAGKTATMAGRVRYLAVHRRIPEHQILAVAFATKASEELKERLAGVGMAGVEVSTMHALGLRVLRDVEGRAPAVSALGQDDVEATRHLVALLEERMTDRQTRGPIVDLLTRYLYARDPRDDYDTGAEYYARIRQLGLRSITGTLHKSLQEVKIANWLTLNGYVWEYEANYPHVPEAKYKSSYNPDFLIRAANGAAEVWLEHFGINRAGRTAPWIDSDAYSRSMEWKRQLHRHAGTVLIESYSYEDDEGTLLDGLAAKLTAVGLPPAPLSNEAARELARSDEGNKTLKILATLLLMFLRLFKGSLLSYEALQGRAAGDRDRTFLTLFADAHAHYETRLRAEAKIDFDDMIARAYEHVVARRFVGTWQHILVDEFQDTSRLRFEMLRQLLCHVEHGRLFVVGDDWQSIFRFAGADVSLFTRMSEWVGEVARTDLDRTHRCSGPLVRLASHFVSRDPSLLQKQVESHATFDPPAPSSPLLLCFHDVGERADFSRDAALELCLRDIAAQMGGRRAEVKLLGRYTWERPENFEQLAEKWHGEGLVLEPMTVHKAKGLEADFVIVLGVSAGKYGFPSGVADDEVLQMILAARDPFPNGEERRLLYVAMTRARRRVYVLSDASRPSAFVQELVELPDEFEIEVVNHSRKHYRCPSCHGRTIHRKSGSFGEFWACMNWPSCSGRLRGCAACGDAPREPVLQAGKIGSFVCPSCQAVSGVCPSCKTGELLLRTGPYGQFHGCSNWQGNGTGCRYTRDAGSRQSARSGAGRRGGRKWDR